MRTLFIVLAFFSLLVTFATLVSCNQSDCPKVSKQYKGQYVKR